MTNNIIKSQSNYIQFALSFMILGATILFSCSDDDPIKEDTPEMITRVTLTFTPVGQGEAVVVAAIDPDGEGVQDLETDGPIILQANTPYTLSIELTNDLVDDASAEGYNITDEISDEGDEHMFFFGWTNNVFSDPAGDGNIDNRDDDVRYEDEDENGLPIGLVTAWHTGDAAQGMFRVVLKHQPDLKSPNSGASSGETDVDVTFEIEVQ